ncbi:type IX secretion system sortase PorU [bacterium]|nr:type IX secretion system sortase PorU [bacterium]
MVTGTAAIICAVSAILLFPERSDARNADTDTAILSSSEQGCTVSWRPANLVIVPVERNGRAYRSVAFDHAVPWTEPGSPQLPARVLLFGVPDGAEVSVTVEVGGERRLGGAAVEPTPDAVIRDGLSADIYREGAAYGSRDVYPGAAYALEGPFTAGTRRIVKVLLFPVRYDPATSELISAAGFTVSLGFSKAAVRRAGPPEPSVSRDPVTASLVNAKAVGTWRADIPAALPKSGTAQSGIRIRIPVREEGVYAISGKSLQDLGVTLSYVDPATIKICGNGGRELPHSLSGVPADTLGTVPCLVEGVEDGTFDSNDRIIFYGRGTDDLEWDGSAGRFRHYLNRYTRTNIYWLIYNDGRDGKRFVPRAGGDPAAATVMSTFRDVVFVEQDINNPVEGGLVWYGHQFRSTIPSYSTQVSMPDPDESEPVDFFFRWVGGTIGQHNFSIDWNDEPVQSLSVTSTLGSEREASHTGTVIDGENRLSMQYSYAGSAPEPYAFLDWFDIEYTRTIRSHDGAVRFFSPAVSGLYAYRLQGFPSRPLVFDVTDPGDAGIVEAEANGGEFRIVRRQEGPEPSRFIACNPGNLPVPAGMSIDENSDLKSESNGGDLLIITHADFMDQALRLAEHRRTADSLQVQTVDIQDVYDEFSAGVFDPTAIRYAVSYAFEHWNPRPSYLLLFGDGDFDYRDIISPAGENWIPPFEFDGVFYSQSRASDDWYTYVSGDDMVMDLAVGRLPVRTAGEARTVVDKIIQYDTNPVQGVWKQVTTLVGDDEKAAGGQGNEINHINASEYIAENVIPDRFNVDKIYLTEYPEVITGDGLRKPEAGDRLIENINQGTIIVNYIGHGNQKLWAHEWIFHRDIDFSRLTNSEKLPLFYAATCSFGWYDRISEQSFGEVLVTTADRGGVATIASCRLCSAPYNEALNAAFLGQLLPDTGPTQRMGDALRLAKLNAGTRSNNEFYHILGDPSQRLAVPRYEAVFTSMQPDTFKALGVIQVEGEIRKDGAVWDGFNGELLLQARDSRKQSSHTTAYGSVMNYVLAGNSLFKGEADVNNGRFACSFVVPKDISYGGVDGRLSTYFWNEETDGAGYRNGIQVGGSGGIVDTEGPELDIGFTGRVNFISGDMIVPPVELRLTIEDNKTGINLTGEIGHKIILTVDDAGERDITDYFSYDKNEYLKGTIVYSLADLPEGNHELRVKAWDNANNSSTASVLLQVVSGEKLNIERVMNYPNPLDRDTDFTFYLSMDARVNIKIFTVSGRLVRTLSGIQGTAGFNMVHWDGTDEMGDRIANGVYLYKVAGTAAAGGKQSTAEKIERLMILRQ